MCASTHAMHSKMVPAMSTLHVYLALCRFLSTHPGCRRLRSDNVRSFVTAGSCIKRPFHSIRDPWPSLKHNGRSVVLGVFGTKGISRGSFKLVMFLKTQMSCHLRGISCQHQRYRCRCRRLAIPLPGT